MLSILAWRNVWRNKTRSLVITIAVMLGLLAGIFTIAFMNGMVNSRIQSITGTELSHIQIHAPGFSDNNQIDIQIPNTQPLRDSLSHLNQVSGVSERIVINCMIASAETGAGVLLKGVDRESEMKVSDLHHKIIEGEYLDSGYHHPIVISERLSQKLKVKLKNKVVITLQDEQQNIVSGAFRISGIFRTDNMMFDESVVWVQKADIGKLAGIERTSAHELAILLNDHRVAGPMAQSLSRIFPSLEIKDWQTLSPEAGYLVSAMNQYMYIFMSIVILALCFGIINTMLMTVMERIKELGMLKAMGMNRYKVFRMILLETVFLTLSGGIMGIMLGYLTCKYTAKQGIDLYFWKEAYAEIGYSTLVYPSIEFNNLIVIGLMILFMSIISAIYPAYKALKLKPYEAINS